MKSLKSAAFTDTLVKVEVESSFVRGLPGFGVVGLAGTTIKESESRVKSALLSPENEKSPKLREKEKSSKMLVLVGDW